jgi:hypothetical protein
VFLNLLAKDADTPAQTLLDLARLLSSTYRPDLGFALLENPTVRSSERGLRVLAGLPGNGGYREVRDRARELLAQITESNAGGLPKKFSGSGTPAISAVSGDRWSDLEVLTVRLGRSRYRSPEAPAACGGLRATVPVPVWRLTGRAARLR